jgi:hypothetical protein
MPRSTTLSGFARRLLEEHPTPKTAVDMAERLAATAKCRGCEVGLRVAAQLSSRQHAV